MPSRQTWPRGLKIIFWLGVAGLVVGTGQTLYWLLVTGEFFPQLTFQGVYAAFALLLATICVLFGTLGLRRAFAITSLATAAFHIGVTAYVSLEIFRIWLPDILARQFQSFLSWSVSDWTYAWNSFEVAIDCVICFYLIRYEIRRSGCSPRS
jgi:hypothetical protein